MNYDLAYRNQKRSPIAEFIISKKVVLDKIHMFEGLHGGLRLRDWDACARDMNKDQWRTVVRNRIANLKTFFIFDNTGNITIVNNSNYFVEVNVKRNYEY